MASLIGKEMRDLMDYDKREKLPIKAQFKNIVVGLMPKIISELRFYKSGELHRWMYDRITLPDILINNGASEIMIQSYNRTTTNVSLEGLDIDSGKEYKPFSLYVEAMENTVK